MNSNVIWLGATKEERLQYNKQARGRRMHAGDALQMLIFLASFVGAFALVMLLF